MEKEFERYAKLYRRVLAGRSFADAEGMAAAFKERLREMYASDAFREHNIYPSMSVDYIYAVIAMCLELKERGLTDEQVIDAVNVGLAVRWRLFDVLLWAIDLLPMGYEIVERWNVSDHARRVEDGSITYDSFEAGEGRVEYSISRCMYVEMFDHYGIRGLCKIFCMTDEHAYASLSRHVRFVRHSDLSDGPCCHDEVINRKRQPA